MENISVGILCGMAAMLGFGLSNAISQTPVKEIGSTRTVFFRNMFTSAMLLALVTFYAKSINFSIRYILIAFVISLIGYIPLLTIYKALKRGKVGVVSPIGNSAVIFTVLFSVLFFGESLSKAQSLSIACIIAGIILISIDFRDIRRSHIFTLSSGVPYALVTCLLWGLLFFLYKIPVDVIGPILTSFMIEFGVLIQCLAHMKISRTSFDKPKAKTLRYIFAVAFFGVIGSISFNIGIGLADVSIVAAIAFANPLVAVMYGKFVYKETLRLQQWAAVLMILIGIVVISYF